MGVPFLGGGRTMRVSHEKEGEEERGELRRGISPARQQRRAKIEACHVRHQLLPLLPPSFLCWGKTEKPRPKPLPSCPRSTAAAAAAAAKRATLSLLRSSVCLGFWAQEEAGSRWMKGKRGEGEVS